jgi:ABC-type polysaccharide/polyol phosphate export permease
MLNKLLAPILESLPENNQMERIWVLAKNDFRKRFYGTSIGIVWALINPLIQLIVYYLVFTYVIKRRTENFALYLFSGLLLWLFFSEATKKGISVLQSKRYLIENIKLNKFDLFTSSLLSVILTLVFNFFVYFLLSIAFSIEYSIYALLFPFLVLNMCIIAFSFSLFLSVINIYLRDISHLWDIVLLVGFWGNPIIWNYKILADKFPLAVSLNPIGGIIVNMRETVLYAHPPVWEYFIIDWLMAFVFLWISITVFKKYSHKAAEML